MILAHFAQTNTWVTAKSGRLRTRCVRIPSFSCRASPSGDLQHEAEPHAAPQAPKNVAKAHFMKAPRSACPPELRCCWPHVRWQVIGCATAMK